MKLFELPEMVKEAVLGSAIAAAAKHEDPNDFVQFWDEVLRSDYSNPLPEPVTKPAEVRPISSLTTAGYIPDPK